MNWFRTPKVITVLKKATSVITSLAVMAMMLVIPFSAAAVSNENWQSYAASGYAGGDGSECNPYLIATEGQFAYLAKEVNGGTNYNGKWFRLTADLNLGAHQWMPVGISQSAAFLGNFDGGGHIVSGLAIGTSSAPATYEYAGLFGSVNGGSLTNLTLNNVVVNDIPADAWGSVGSFSGEFTGDSIKNCFASGQITGCQNVGGLVGYSSSLIDSCASDVNVSGDKGLVGGIAGVNYSPIKNCSATGSIKGGIKNSDNSELHDGVGGISGETLANITNCFFTGSISFTGDSTNNFIGGIAGMSDAENNNSGNITNCYCAAASVSVCPSFNYGGIVGYTLFGGKESGNYWRTDYTNPVAFSNGESRSTPSTDVKMTDADMKQAPFINKLNGGVTDGCLAWQTDSTGQNGGYPVFTPLDSDVSLSKLTVYADSLNLIPEFRSDTLDYSASVADTVSGINVNASAHCTASSVTVNGQSLSNGSTTLALDFGVNVIGVKVTAQNGLTRLYTITVTRNASKNADLSNLTVSSGTLSPSFAKDNYSYNVSLPYNVSTTTITPTLANSLAMVIVDGYNIGSGNPSQEISLGQGETRKVNVVVIAEDGVTKNTYIVNITRQKQEVPALSSLSFSTGSLSPTFDSNMDRYVLTVPQSATSVKITPIAARANETVQVNNINLVDGSATINLTSETSQLIRISVNASDGSRTNTYSVYITWPRPNWQDSGSVAGSFSGGSGSATDPYLISNAGQLAYLAQQVNGGNTYSGYYFSLTGDINLNGRDWTPIGSETHGFWGTFDGRGHKITGLTIGTSADPSMRSGLFYLIGNLQSHTVTGTVKNVSVDANEYVYATNGGCLVTANCGTIDNCSVSGLISGIGSGFGGISAYNCGVISSSHNSAVIKGNSASLVGGVAGMNRGQINGCYSTGDISGDESMGGIVGENQGDVVNSYSRGTLTGGANSNIGGIAGDNVKSIINCYSAASLTGGDCSDPDDETSIGGIAGYSCGSIANCYAIGNLVSTATSDMGGIVGDSEGSNVTNDYWSLGETQKIGDTICTASQQKGIGNGTDSGTKGLTATDMTSTTAVTTFAQTLNNNRTVDGTLWKYISGINDGFPVLNGTGEGCSSNAALSSLQIDMGTLSPQFTSSQMGYTLIVGNDTTNLTVTPTVSDTWATVKVNGEAVISGSPAVVNLTPGSNTAINIAVTAQDGTTINTYSITAVRPASVSGITISPSVSSVIQGQTQTFTADMTTTGNATKAVTWSVLPGDKSNKTAIDSNGKLTVDANETASVLTVKATSVFDASQSATATITVLPSKITDSNTNITYDLSDVNLPSDVTSTSIGITTIPQSSSDDSTFTIVKKLLDSNTFYGKLSGFRLIDLKLLNQNGNPIEPTGGAVTVRIPIPSGMSDNLHVFWFNPTDGSLQDMNAKQEGDYLVFQTTHFSDYAIAQLIPSPNGGNSTGGTSSGESEGNSATATTVPSSKSGETSSGESKGNSTTAATGSNPTTGSGDWPIIPLAILGGSAAAGAIIVKRRRSFRKKKQAE